MSRVQLIRSVHVGCRDLGFDDETRHGMQTRVTGKSSLADMSLTELKLVVEDLKAKGWAPKRRKKARPLAKRADVRFIHVLWRLLSDAEEAHTPGRTGLNNFIRQRFGKAWGSLTLDVDGLTDPEQIDHVISALKNWCKRKGIEVSE